MHIYMEVLLSEIFFVSFFFFLQLIQISLRIVCWASKELRNFPNVQYISPGVQIRLFLTDLWMNKSSLNGHFLLFFVWCSRINASLRITAWFALLHFAYEIGEMPASSPWRIFLVADSRILSIYSTKWVIKDVFIFDNTIVGVEEIDISLSSLEQL